MKSAVFSCRGLGDGAIALTLSKNLASRGDEVVTFHPFLSELQHWFPDFPLRKFPEEEKELLEFDSFFFFLDGSPKMCAFIRFCEERFPEKTFVLNPTATPYRDVLYWDVGRFCGKTPLLHNVVNFCRETLKIENASTESGLVPPAHLTLRKYEKRIVLHPTSSEPRRNWPKEKFLRLARRLEDEGYTVTFLLASHEREGWEGVTAPFFRSLSETAAYLYESGYLIGNDSGLGHLASLMGIPTVTICRRLRFARFWRPAWALGELVLPPRLIPNMKGLRLRDRYWKELITVGAVARKFNQLKGISFAKRATSDLVEPVAGKKTS